MVIIAIFALAVLDELRSKLEEENGSVFWLNIGGLLIIEERKSGNDSNFPRQVRWVCFVVFHPKFPLLKSKWKYCGMAIRQSQQENTATDDTQHQRESPAEE